MTHHRHSAHAIAVAKPNLAQRLGAEFATLTQNGRATTKRQKIGLVLLGTWKMILGVITFKTVEAALHSPDHLVIGAAGLAALATVFPSVILLWLSEE